MWVAENMNSSILVLTMVVILVAILLGLLDAWMANRESEKIRSSLEAANREKEILLARIEQLERAARLKDARIRLTSTAMEDLAVELFRKSAEVRVCEREIRHLREVLEPSAVVASHEQTDNLADEIDWQLNLNDYPEDGHPDEEYPHP